MANEDDVILLTLTLRMTTAQVVQTSDNVNNNSPIHDYVHPGDHTQPTYEAVYPPTFFVTDCKITRCSSKNVFCNSSLIT